METGMRNANIIIDNTSFMIQFTPQYFLPRTRLMIVAIVAVKFGHANTKYNITRSTKRTVSIVLPLV